MALRVSHPAPPPTEWGRRALGTLLRPVLAWQRRRVAQSLSERPGAEATGQHGHAPKRLRLLIMGDTLVCGTTSRDEPITLAHQTAAALSHCLGDTLQRPVAVSWQLFCRPGLTAQAAVTWLAKAQLQPADVLVTLLGLDDALHNTRPRAWLTALDALRGHAHHRANVRHVVHCAPPRLDWLTHLPQPLRAMATGNAYRLDDALRHHLRQAARRSRCVLPQEEAVCHERWAQALARHIEFDLSEASLQRATLPSGFHPSGFYTEDDAAAVKRAPPTARAHSSVLDRRGSLQRFHPPG